MTDLAAALAAIINDERHDSPRAIAEAIVAAGWRREPDTLRAAADALALVYMHAMRDGRDREGIGAYATAADAVVWLRARASLREVDLSQDPGRPDDPEALATKLDAFKREGR